MLERDLTEPTLTAPELEGLAGHPDPAVRAAVARHPNTSASTLGHLAADFPAEVLANPALPLLRLADPLLLRGWPEEGLAALLRQPGVPAWVRRHAAQGGSTRLQVLLAEHPTLPLPELRALAAHPAWLVRARVAARADLPQDLLPALIQDPDYGVRLAVAARPDLPAASIQALLQDPSRFVQQVMRQTLGSAGPAAGGAQRQA